MKKQSESGELDYENFYETSDIDVASALICKGYTLTNVTNLLHKKVSFVFKNHPSLVHAVEGFWSNRIEVRPLEFANNRKNLKSRIFGMQKDY